MSVIVAIVLIVAIAYIFYPQRRETGKEPIKREQRPLLKGIPYQPPERSEKEAPSLLEKQKIIKKVVIIIDDIGYDLFTLNELLEIDAPITFAVLPHLPHSVDAAHILHREGREIILHLPMEPQNYPEKNPGSGALFLRMSEEEIRQQVEDDLDAVPYIIGVNNHMGSRFMEDRTKLAIVFEQIRERGLFFVDSQTTPYSKGRELAEEMELRFAARDIFIDNAQDYKATLRILMDLMKKRSSKKRGPFILSGHPHATTIRALQEALPLMKARGVEIIPVSDLFEITGEEP